MHDGHRLYLLTRPPGCRTGGGGGPPRPYGTHARKRWWPTGAEKWCR
ncbi:hypothetical protein [Streptomyces sp. URMC 124]